MRVSGNATYNNSQEKKNDMAGYISSESQLHAKYLAGFAHEFLSPCQRSLGLFLRNGTYFFVNNAVSLFPQPVEKVDHPVG